MDKQTDKSEGTTPTHNDEGRERIAVRDGLAEIHARLYEAADNLGGGALAGELESVARLAAKLLDASPIRLVYGSLEAVDTVPSPLPLEQIPTHDLIIELHKRQRLVPNPHGVEPCLTLAVTPGDLAEFWESDESRRNRVPEPSEWPALVKAFERWQDCGSFTDLMETLRDAWHAEQARQKDAQEGEDA